MIEAGSKCLSLIALLVFAETKGRETMFPSNTFNPPSNLPPLHSLSLPDDSFDHYNLTHAEQPNLSTNPHNFQTCQTFNSIINRTVVNMFTNTKVTDHSLDNITANNSSDTQKKGNNATVEISFQTTLGKSQFSDRRMWEASRVSITKRQELINVKGMIDSSTLNNSNEVDLLQNNYNISVESTKLDETTPTTESVISDATIKQDDNSVSMSHHSEIISPMLSTDGKSNDESTTFDHRTVDSTQNPTFSNSQEIIKTSYDQVEKFEIISTLTDINSYQTTTPSYTTATNDISYSPHNHDNENSTHKLSRTFQGASNNFNNFTTPSNIPSTSETSAEHILNLTSTALIILNSFDHKIVAVSAVTFDFMENTEITPSSINNETYPITSNASSSKLPHKMDPNNARVTRDTYSTDKKSSLSFQTTNSISESSSGSFEPNEISDEISNWNDRTITEIIGPVTSSEFETRNEILETKTEGKIKQFTTGTNGFTSSISTSSIVNSIDKQNISPSDASQLLSNSKIVSVSTLFPSNSTIPNIDSTVDQKLSITHTNSTHYLSETVDRLVTEQASTSPLSYLSSENDSSFAISGDIESTKLRSTNEVLIESTISNLFSTSPSIINNDISGKTVTNSIHTPETIALIKIGNSKTDLTSLNDYHQNTNNSTAIILTNRNDTHNSVFPPNETLEITDLTNEHSSILISSKELTENQNISIPNTSEKIISTSGVSISPNLLINPISYETSSKLSRITLTVDIVNKTESAGNIRDMPTDNDVGSINEIITEPMAFRNQSITEIANLTYNSPEKYFLNNKNVYSSDVADQITSTKIISILINSKIHNNNLTTTTNMRNISDIRDQNKTEISKFPSDYPMIAKPTSIEKDSLTFNQSEHDEMSLSPTEILLLSTSNIFFDLNASTKHNFDEENFDEESSSSNTIDSLSSRSRESSLVIQDNISSATSTDQIFDTMVKDIPYNSTLSCNNNYRTSEIMRTLKNDSTEKYSTSTNKKIENKNSSADIMTMNSTAMFSLTSFLNTSSDANVFESHTEYHIQNINLTSTINPETELESNTKPTRHSPPITSLDNSSLGNSLKNSSSKNSSTNETDGVLSSAKKVNKYNFSAEHQTNSVSIPYSTTSLESISSDETTVPHSQSPSDRSTIVIYNSNSSDLISARDFVNQESTCCTDIASVITTNEMHVQNTTEQFNSALTSYNLISNEKNNSLFDTSNLISTIVLEQNNTFVSNSINQREITRISSLVPLSEEIIIEHFASSDQITSTKIDSMLLNETIQTSLNVSASSALPQLSPNGILSKNKLNSSFTTQNPTNKSLFGTIIKDEDLLYSINSIKNSTNTSKSPTLDNKINFMSNLTSNGNLSFGTYIIQSEIYTAQNELNVSTTNTPNYSVIKDNSIINKNVSTSVESEQVQSSNYLFDFTKTIANSSETIKISATSNNLESTEINGITAHPTTNPDNLNDKRHVTILPSKTNKLITSSDLRTNISSYSTDVLNTELSSYQPLTQSSILHESSSTDASFHEIVNTKHNLSTIYTEITSDSSISPSSNTNQSQRSKADLISSTIFSDSTNTSSQLLQSPSNNIAEVRSYSTNLPTRNPTSIFSPTEVERTHQGENSKTSPPSNHRTTNSNEEIATNTGIVLKINDSDTSYPVGQTINDGLQSSYAKVMIIAENKLSTISSTDFFTSDGDKLIKINTSNLFTEPKTFTNQITKTNSDEIIRSSINVSTNKKLVSSISKYETTDFSTTNSDFKVNGSSTIIDQTNSEDVVDQTTKIISLFTSKQNSISNQISSINITTPITNTNISDNPTISIMTRLPSISQTINTNKFIGNVQTKSQNNDLNSTPAKHDVTISGVITSASSLNSQKSEESLPSQTFMHHGTTESSLSSQKSSVGDQNVLSTTSKSIDLLSNTIPINHNLSNVTLTTEIISNIKNDTWTLVTSNPMKSLKSISSSEAVYSTTFDINNLSNTIFSDYQTKKEDKTDFVFDYNFSFETRDINNTMNSLNQTMATDQNPILNSPTDLRDNSSFQFFPTSDEIINTNSIFPISNNSTINSNLSKYSIFYSPPESTNMITSRTETESTKVNNVITTLESFTKHGYNHSSETFVKSPNDKSSQHISDSITTFNNKIILETTSMENLLSTKNLAPVGHNSTSSSHNFITTYKNFVSSAINDLTFNNTNGIVTSKILSAGDNDKTESISNENALPTKYEVAHPATNNIDLDSFALNRRTSEIFGMISNNGNTIEKSQANSILSSELTTDGSDQSSSSINSYYNKTEASYPLSSTYQTYQTTTYNGTITSSVPYENSIKNDSTSISKSTPHHSPNHVNTANVISSIGEITGANSILETQSQMITPSLEIEIVNITLSSHGLNQRYKSTLISEYQIETFDYIINSTFDRNFSSEINIEQTMSQTATQDNPHLPSYDKLLSDRHDLQSVTSGQITPIGKNSLTNISNFFNGSTKSYGNNTFRTSQILITYDNVSRIETDSRYTSVEPNMISNSSNFDEKRIDRSHPAPLINLTITETISTHNISTETNTIENGTIEFISISSNLGNVITTPLPITSITISTFNISDTSKSTEMSSTLTFNNLTTLYYVATNQSSEESSSKLPLDINLKGTDARNSVFNSYAKTLNFVNQTKITGSDSSHQNSVDDNVVSSSINSSITTANELTQTNYIPNNLPTTFIISIFTTSIPHSISSIESKAVDRNSLHSSTVNEFYPSKNGASNTSKFQKFETIITYPLLSDFVNSSNNSKYNNINFESSLESNYYSNYSPLESLFTTKKIYFTSPTSLFMNLNLSSKQTIMQLYSKSRNDDKDFLGSSVNNNTKISTESTLNFGPCLTCHNITPNEIVNTLSFSNSSLLPQRPIENYSISSINSYTLSVNDFQSSSHGRPTGSTEITSTENLQTKNDTNYSTAPNSTQKRESQVTNETDIESKTTNVFSSNQTLESHASNQTVIKQPVHQISSTQMINPFQIFTYQTAGSPATNKSSDSLTTHPYHKSGNNSSLSSTKEANENIKSTASQTTNHKLFTEDQSQTKDPESILMSSSLFSLLLATTSTNSKKFITTTPSLIILTEKTTNITSNTTVAMTTATTSTTPTNITTTMRPIHPVGYNHSNSPLPSTPNDLCKNVSQCPDNSWCQIIQGSPSCNCKSGYTKFGSICLDVDECIIGSHNCNPQTSICINTNGGYTCTCLPGYGGTYCTDVNECDPSEPPVCDAKGFCINQIGSFRCFCPSNYQLAKDNKTCIDVDECMTKTSGCSDYCTNLEGGFTCTCQTGLILDNDSKTCIVTTPCQSLLICPYKCSQINGSDTCLCPVGFKTSLGSCIDADECSENNPCDSVRGICINTRGSFTCACIDGYTLGPNYSCNDRDGGWSAWGGWSPCHKSCQGGLRTRRRTCVNPNTEGLGLGCQGNGSESEICNTQDCPLTEEEAKYGIHIYIKGLELSKFMQVNPVMLEILAEALNNYCLSNQKNLRSCCGKPTDIIPFENDTRTLIKWQNILSGNGFPRKVSELLIKTLLVVKFPKDNELCRGVGSKTRRRRAVSSSDPAVSQQVADASMTDSVFYNAQNSLMQSVLMAFNQSKNITVYKDDQKSGTAIPWWTILLIILAIILLIIIIIIIIICCCKCCKKKKRRVNPDDNESRPRNKHERKMAVMQKKKDKESQKEEKRRQKELEKQEKEKSKREKELEKQKRKERENENEDMNKKQHESPEKDKFKGHPSEPRDQTSAHRNRRPVGVGHMQHADDDSAKSRVHSASSRKGSRGAGSLSSMFPDIDDDSPVMNPMPGNKFIKPSKVEPISVKLPH